MALETAELLRRNGHDVRVVLPEKGPLFDLLEARGIAVAEVAVPVLRKRYLKPRALLGFAASSLVGAVKAVLTIRTEQPDVIVVNTITQPTWMLVAKLCRRSVVCHVRESESQLSTLIRWVILAPVRWSDLVIANSDATARFLRQTRGLRFPRISVVYNGKDWAPYFLSEPAPHPSRTVILIVGRLSPRKGQDLALDAAQLVALQGKPLEVVLAGDVFPGYEWFREQLIARAQALTGDISVRFEGYVSDVALLLKESDIVLVPSRSEPFGTVAAEGMAAMRPVIVSDVEGLKEIVQHGVTGLTFENSSVSDLAAQLTVLIEDPILGGQLASAGRESVLVRFSREKYEMHMLEALDSVVNKRPVLERTNR